LELIIMALVIHIARFISRLNAAFNEALQARQAARRKYPNLPDE
jgi:hypothetical protein